MGIRFEISTSKLTRHSNQSKRNMNFKNFIIQFNLFAFQGGVVSWSCAVVRSLWGFADGSPLSLTFITADKVGFQRLTKVSDDFNSRNCAIALANFVLGDA